MKGIHFMIGMGKILFANDDKTNKNIDGAKK